MVEFSMDSEKDSKFINLSIRRKHFHRSLRSNCYLNPIE
jgi:hypothetical protein